MKHSQPIESSAVDVVIVGGGPAGIAVAYTLKQAGIGHLVLEKGPVAAHIAQYPNFMQFFSTNDNLEIAGFPLAITAEKPSRREYIQYLARFARYHELNLRPYTEVIGVDRQPEGGFLVRTRRAGNRQQTITARAVVMAVGAWECPRRLGVPGDDLPKVRYRFTEPHDYTGTRVLVVGGRNSAVETALILWRSGAEVALSYRGTEFNGRGLKYWLRPDIENRIQRGEITGYLGSRVERIDWESVDLRLADGRLERIDNDFVLPLLGYDPPVDFLRRAGIDIEAGTNIPAHDEATLETNIPGLFVAGTIIAGNVSGHVFIENSRHHGEMMLERIRELAGKA